MKGLTMYVRNITTSTMFDNNDNRQGEPRFSLEVAWDVAHIVNAHHDAMTRAIMARREASAFVEWLGDKAREHAIDNSLCGNYEAFLSITIGEYHSECVDAKSRITDMVEDFVVNATRPRRHTATVSVPVAVTRVAIQNTLNRYGEGARDTAYAIANNGEHSGFSVQQYEATMKDMESEALSYDEAQEANENFHRRGRYSNDNNDDGTCDCGQC
jgi:hypothetical protein